MRDFLTLDLRALVVLGIVKLGRRQVRTKILTVYFESAYQNIKGLFVQDGNYVLFIRQSYFYERFRFFVVDSSCFSRFRSAAKRAVPSPSGFVPNGTL